MAKIPNKIKSIIEEYLTLLIQNDIPIKSAYLFGSYAKNNSNEWSDIDIALVSNVFEGIRIKDRDKIRKFTLAISSSLEVIPFHPNDFTSENPFAKEIIETGIKLL